MSLHQACILNGILLFFYLRILASVAITAFLFYLFSVVGIYRFRLQNRNYSVGYIYMVLVWCEGKGREVKELMATILCRS